MNDRPSEKEEMLDELPTRGEAIGFKPEQLSACPKCRRPNGPDRLNCLYCGSEMPMSAVTVEPKLNFRQLEVWENGKNIVVSPPSGPTDPRAAAEIARMLSADPDVVGRMLSLQRPMPIARVETDDESKLIMDRLADLGVQSKTITDDQLMAARPPTRVRGLRFEESMLVLTPFNSGDQVEITYERLALFVTGTIFRSRSETLEKRRRRKTEVVSEWVSTSDEPLIDIYSREDPTGWRVRSGFDFSCLGGDKTILSADNIRRLIRHLVDRASHAVVVDDYRSCRPSLDEVWPPDQQRESLGVLNSGSTRKEFKKAAAISNLTQFTRFSRLQWHLL